MSIAKESRFAVQKLDNYLDEGSLPDIMALSDAENITLVDLKISALEEDIRLLRNKRNELVPVSRLSSDVLCTIFLFVRDLSNAEQTRPRSPSWFNLTYVCQQWRILALDSATLWSTLASKDTFSLKRMQTFCERSKNATLSITFPNYGSDTKSQCIQLALSQAHRLNSLTGGTGNIAVTHFSQPTNVSAPNLQSLELVANPTIYNDPRTRPLPPNFAAGAPKLRFLALQNLTLPWTSPVFDGLTSLSLRGRRVGSFGTPLQFFEAMEKMPRLRHLTLDIPDGFTDAIECYRGLHSVSLNVLEKLYLNASAATCTSIFNRLVLPTSASVDLRIWFIASGNIHSQCHDLVSAIKSAWLLSSVSLPDNSNQGVEFHPVIKSIRMRKGDTDLYYYSGSSITAWFQNSDFYDFPTQISYKRDTANLYIMVDEPDAMQVLVAGLPLDGLQSFCVSSLEFTNPLMWSTLGHIPSLQSVVIDESNLASLIQPIPNLSGGLEPSVLNTNSPFHNLTHLSIHDADFGARRNYKEGIPNLGFLPVDIVDFIAFLESRPIPLKSLTLYNCCNLTHDDVRLLKKMVGGVHWDGRAISQNDSDLEGSDSSECEDECGECHVCAR